MIWISTCPVCKETRILIHQNSDRKSRIQWDIDTQNHVIRCRLKEAILKPFNKKLASKKEIV